MQGNTTSAARACSACREGTQFEIPFGFAFQPIVDVRERRVYAHEALVRGIKGEPAPSVLGQVTEESRYSFDQACRRKAITQAAALGIGEHLSINFLPNAVYRPEVCIRTTLQAASETGFPIDRIIFEATEGERLTDVEWLVEVFSGYQRLGFRTAIDDFGAGFSGLNLLARFQPDLVKIDMDLIRDIHTHKPRQAIVRGVLRTCEELGIEVIAEGIETAEERDFLVDAGVRLMQGWLFARPAFDAVASINEAAWPDLARVRHPRRRRSDRGSGN